jgi:hypothetical protein
MTNYDSKVWLYALADPTIFAEQANLIERFVCEALNVPRSARRPVSISPSSGWFDYVALDELWERRTPPALPDAATALAAAEGALARIEQKCSDANRQWPSSLRGLRLLPPVGMLRRVSLEAVPRPDGLTLDHWLYRAEPRLTLDGSGSNRVGVYGAAIEVRVGHQAQPISVCSRWTPLSGEKMYTDLTPFRALVADASSTAANPGDATASPPFVSYLLEGDGVPQFYLAPYYVQLEDHGATLSSASPYSLTLDLARTGQSESRMTLAAVALGGSGRYVYNWARYSIGAIEEGIREIGPGQHREVATVEGRVNGSSIEIDNGAYIVLLNVKDTQTGAFKHHQQQVVASTILGDSATGNALLGIR